MSYFPFARYFLKSVRLCNFHRQLHFHGIFIDFPRILSRFSFFFLLFFLGHRTKNKLLKWFSDREGPSRAGASGAGRGGPLRKLESQTICFRRRQSHFNPDFFALPNLFVRRSRTVCTKWRFLPRRVQGGIGRGRGVTGYFRSRYSRHDPLDCFHFFCLIFPRVELSFSLITGDTIQPGHSTPLAFSGWGRSAAMFGPAPIYERSFG